MLTQFPVGAAVLSSFGGLIGIAPALAGSLWLPAMLNMPFVFFLSSLNKFNTDTRITGMVTWFICDL